MPIIYNLQVITIYMPCYLLFFFWTYALFKYSYTNRIVSNAAEIWLLRSEVNFPIVYRRREVLGDVESALGFFVW